MHARSLVPDSRDAARRVGMTRALPIITFVLAVGLFAPTALAQKTEVENAQTLLQTCERLYLECAKNCVGAACDACDSAHAVCVSNAKTDIDEAARRAGRDGQQPPDDPSQPPEGTPQPDDRAGGGGSAPGACSQLKAPCEDGFYCTSAEGYAPGPDECTDSGCEGREIIDQDTWDVTPYDIDIDAIVGQLKGVTSALQLGPCDLEPPSIVPSVAFTVSGFKRCCEEKQQVLAGKKISGSASISLGGIECPIPGLALDFKVAKVGVFVGLRGSGSVTASGDDDPCEQGCTTTVAASLGIEVFGNVQVSQKVNPDLLKIKGEVAGGGSVEYERRCGESSVSGCVGPVRVSAEITLAGFYRKSAGRTLQNSFRCTG